MPLLVSAGCCRRIKAKCIILGGEEGECIYFVALNNPNDKKQNQIAN